MQWDGSHITNAPLRLVFFRQKDSRVDVWLFRCLNSSISGDHGQRTLPDDRCRIAYSWPAIRI
jgi:hypothetical protein